VRIVGGLVIILFGLQMMGVLKIGALYRDTRKFSEDKPRGPLGAALLGVAFAAVFSKVQPMVFGETTAKQLPHRPMMAPVFVHMALVLMLGLWIPPFLADWYRQAAKLIG